MIRQRSAPLMTAAFALTLLLVIGCGDSGDDEGESRADAPAAAEDELAASLLVTLDDLPAGWAEEIAGDEDEDDPYEECDLGDPAGRTGRAETGGFSRGGSASFSHAVAVFESPEAALVALSPVLDAVTCRASVINSGGFDNDEFEFSDASVSRIGFPDLGDRTEAYRVTVFVKSKTETGLGSSGKMFIDVINVVVGRFGTSIAATDVFSPFDTGLLETLAGTAVERITATIEASATQ